MKIRPNFHHQCVITYMYDYFEFALYKYYLKVLLAPEITRLNGRILVEREVLIFFNNCALPDTSMTLSAFVFQTFLDIKSLLANAIFSIFRMATMIFKMAVKLIIIQQIKANL